MRKLLIVVLFVLATPGIAVAQALWGPTKVGMSPEEVVSAVKGAKRVAEGTHISKGGVELVRATNFKLVDANWTQRFYFRDGGLIQVTFSLDGEFSFSAATSIFKSLVEVLRARYGPELAMEVNEGGLLKTASADWIDGRTNIGLLAMAVGSSEDAMLNLVYQNRIAAEADKL